MLNKKTVQIITFTTLILLNGLLTACGTPDVEPTEITLQLKWLHQTQFAGFYIADQEGYYEDENLTVTINPINLDRQVTIDYIMEGEADIGIAAAEEIIIARNEGKPVQAVAVIFRLNPLAFIAPAEEGIIKPEDLIGKHIALGPGQSTYLYEIMMANAGIDRDQIEETLFTGFDIYECWEIADICSHYATNGLARAINDGLETTVIWPSDYGVPFYADVIYATDQFIEQHPDVVQRFVQASLKGWQHAIENPELAATATLVMDSELDEGFQTSAMNTSIPLIDIGQDSIGLMRAEVWQQMHDILLEQGLITEAVDLTTVFTNEFVETEQ